MFNKQIFSVVSGCDRTYIILIRTDNKLVKYAHKLICTEISRNKKEETRKETRMKVYKTMAMPRLPIANESWVINVKKTTLIQQM